VDVPVRRSRLADPARRSRAQALVELAMIMPLFLGIVTILFQFGILFIAYLSIVHETRDIGRFVAVHPDTIDGTCATTGLWKQVCDDAPSVIDKNLITPVSFTPACVTLTAAPALACPTRTSGSQMKISLKYNAASIIFLPTTFRLGPWLNVVIPTSLPAYDYYVMVEPH
jgi:hypothetical protein